MRMMAKTFMLNVDNLSSNEDEKKIRDYFETNLDGVEKLESLSSSCISFIFSIKSSLKLISVHYNEGIGSPKYILDAFNHLGYTVR